jgi:hypothetical protein
VIWDNQFVGNVALLGCGKLIYSFHAMISREKESGFTQ